MLLVRELFPFTCSKSTSSSSERRVSWSLPDPQIPLQPSHFSWPLIALPCVRTSTLPADTRRTPRPVVLVLLPEQYSGQMYLPDGLGRRPQRVHDPRLSVPPKILRLLDLPPDWGLKSAFRWSRMTARLVLRHMSTCRHRASHCRFHTRLTSWSTSLPVAASHQVHPTVNGNSCIPIESRQQSVISSWRLEGLES